MMKFGNLVGTTPQQLSLMDWGGLLPEGPGLAIEMSMAQGKSTPSQRPPPRSRCPHSPLLDETRGVLPVGLMPTQT